jgi:hypothetical protein
MKNIFLTLIAVAVLTSCGAPAAASEAAPVVDTTKVDSTITTTVDTVAVTTPSVEEVK